MRVRVSAGAHAFRCVLDEGLPKLQLSPKEMVQKTLPKELEDWDFIYDCHADTGDRCIQVSLPPKYGDSQDQVVWLEIGQWLLIFFDPECCEWEDEEGTKPKFTCTGFAIMDDETFQVLTAEITYG